MFVVNRHVVRVRSWISCQYMTILNAAYEKEYDYITKETII